MTFDVSEERVTLVEKVLLANYPKLTQEQVMEVAYEIGLADGITFDPEGVKPPKIALSDLQLVSFVAAIAAVVEAGGKQSMATTATIA